LRAAGDAARKEYHNAEAVRFYNFALEMAQDEERSDIMESLGETEYHAGRLDEVAKWLNKARAVTSKRDKLVIMAARLARVLDRQGKFRESLEILARDEPDERTSLLARARWKASMAWVRMNLREFDDILHLAQDALADFKNGGGSADDIADCWNTIGGLNAEQNRYAEAESEYKDGLAIAEAGGATYQAGRLLYNLAQLELRKGRHKESLDLVEKSYHLSDRIGNPFSSAICLNMIGELRFMFGDLGQSFDTFTNVVSFFKEVGARHWLSLSMKNLAVCTLEMGRPEDAENLVREALSLIGTSEEGFLLASGTLAQILIQRKKPSEAINVIHDFKKQCQGPESVQYQRDALYLLGAAYSAQGKRKEAERAFMDAYNLGSGLIHAWTQAVGLRWWGEALASWGEKEKAIEKLEEARKRFTEMGAALELRKTEAALSKLRAT
jgi:tetratricopeptide (TPR) repeat protein